MHTKNDKVPKKNIILALLAFGMGVLLIALAYCFTSPIIFFTLGILGVLWSILLHFISPRCLYGIKKILIDFTTIGIVFSFAMMTTISARSYNILFTTDSFKLLQVGIAILMGIAAAVIFGKNIFPATDNEMKFIFKNALFGIAVAFVIYICVMEAGVIYDFSSPSRYEVKVNDLEKEQNLIFTEYNIYIKDESIPYLIEKVRLTGSQYKKLKTGDKVKLLFYDSALGITWLKAVVE
ncbi:hypothetical protein SAMN05216249_10972 [Acetitomaculum ruminis DSM 5522]|uniref:Uncharacterized protein n=1 Tax=Acetitomaculum ruminis DSM 5522 TaxID=1120918 RepID=A0A1I0YC78_9FIRM|nr:hypothetical protein [Acetitomaculum ruminis]SFB10366.1 hypothetical protein SAMN05216249_10972 [Acetitomaculum ruminis DSM 5522]